MDTDARAVRAAQSSDAADIGLVHVRAWQVTYAGHFPQEFLDALDPAQRGDVWRRYFERGPSDREALLVSDIGTHVGGFANVGPSRDEGADGVGEVYAIYLLPELWGQGLGRDLMVAALDALAGHGFGEATLWVLNANERARRFYEAGGWSADGATRIDDARGFPVVEVRYRRALA